MIEIINGDCNEIMPKMRKESFDLIITSPPYNINNNGGKFHLGKVKNFSPSGYDGYSDNMPHSQYVEWQRECLKEMWRLIKNTGAIYYNHKWRVKDGILQQRNDIVSVLPLRQIIIWQRSGGVNFSQCFYLPTFEVIYIFAKSEWRLRRKGGNIGDVWNITQDQSNPHPAPFPLELPLRIMKTNNCNRILDPFAGSGTTLKAAAKLGLHCTGIDKSKKYCAMAEKRIHREQ